MKPTFDCHNMTYSEVEDKFENWILLNSKNLPADVITGNSQKMLGTTWANSLGVCALS